MIRDGKYPRLWWAPANRVQGAWVTAEFDTYAIDSIERQAFARVSWKDTASWFGGAGQPKDKYSLDYAGPNLGNHWNAQLQVLAAQYPNQNYLTIPKN
jgi:hypothetical protein